MRTFDENTFKVNDGATECFYSDRHAGTIVRVANGGKTVTVQRDNATRTDDRGMSDAQEYKYERDSDGVETVYTLRNNGKFVARGSDKNTGTRLVPGRHEYYDFTF